MRICITCEGVSEETPAERCTHCGTVLLDTNQVHYPQRRGETDATNPLIGKLIGGKYRILNVLGRGGMGTVFMAIHEVSLVPVAVKILHPRFASRPDYRSWFLAEASKAGRVVHENSARIQDVSEAPDGSVYIAMEFVDGSTLADLLAGGRSLAPATALSILEQMLRALDAAHNSGVVHRDLTLRNVMVAMREGLPHVKVLDFGIAKGAPQTVPVLRSSSEEPLSPGPQGLASPPYSAPEYLEGQEVDGRADLFSLGVIAYRCLTGRLPVASGTGAEMARATIAGQIDALGPVPGVPARMQRLVDALLERDPENRPASAAVVAEELRIIRESRGRMLRFAALALLVLSILVFAVAYIPRGSAFLRSVSGSGVPLHSTPESAVADVQLVRSQDIVGWTLEYGNLDPQRILVRVSREGLVLDEIQLQPAVDHERGELRIATDEQARRAFAAVLASHSQEAPIRLEFELPGGTRLAIADLRIDDEAPRVGLSANVGANAVLNGDAVILVDYGESEDLLSLSLVLDGPAVGGMARSLPIDLGDANLPSIAGMLSQELDGYSDLGALTLVLEARDLTGNLARSEPLEFQHTDLRAPTVLMASRPGGGTRLTYNSEGAELEVMLSTVESNLDVIVRAPSGEEARYPLAAELDGSRFRVRLSPAEDGELYPEGRYSVWVSDRFGNAGASYVGEFQFSSEDPSPRLDIASEEDQLGRAVRVGEQIVTNGEQLILRFRCNPLYSPDRIVLTPVSGGPAVDVSMQYDSAGEARVVVPPLASGNYLMVVSMRDQRAAIQREAPYDLRALPDPIRLSLPDLQGARFLQDLLEKQVFQWSGEHLELGLAWRWQPEDLRLLRGSFWVGAAERLDPLSELDGVEDRAELLTGFRPRIGLNRIGFDLQDLFGRPVELQIAGEEVALPSGSRGEAILQFFHDPEAFTASDRTSGFEYGRDMRLLLESSLPFTQDDEIYLAIGDARLLPERRSGAEGAFYIFRLPFRRVVESAAITGLSESDFSAGRRFILRVSLVSPAGVQEMDLDGVTVRSALSEVRLEEIVNAGALLESVVGDMRLVPILRLGPGEVFADPVPMGVSARAAFRNTPAISTSNIGDFYLGEAELTRAQYWGIVNQAVALDPESAGGWRELVHAADPLGRRRLSAAGMLPLTLDDEAAWSELLASAGDRPVTGVNFFQAFSAARMAGWLVCGDPSLLRLPLGVELEFAAMGPSLREGAALNAAALAGAAGSGFNMAEFLAQRDAQDWPLTRSELIAAGDVLETALGSSLVGLDFGVREWVLDIPYAASARILFADHVQLLRALGLFAADGEGVPEQLRPLAAINGVVRGLAVGETRGLIDGLRGESVDSSARALPPSVPGVVRTLVLRRDGAGLMAGQLDPQLRMIGFRLAGDTRLIERVRRR